MSVDTKANFQCNITQNAIETVSCDRYLLLSCQPPIAGCTGSGIAVNSATISNGAYQFTLVGSALTIVNNVTAINKVTEADFSFSIAGLDRVDEFFINAIHSDNYVGIAVNGSFLGVHGRAFGGWNANATKLIKIPTTALPMLDGVTTQPITTKPRLATISKQASTLI